MKKKAVVLLLGGTMALMMTGSVAQAKTYGYSWVGDDEEIRYYERREEQEYPEDSTESSSEASNGKTPDAEAPEKYSAYHKTEMWEALSYLEKYGVVYDAENDRILYEGRKVRWLIDNQIDDLYKAFEMPDGEIDLYTVRGDDYQVTGVRVATQEEYDERTRMDEEIQKGKWNELTITLEDPSEEPLCGSVLYELAEEDGRVSYRISEAESWDAEAGTQEMAGDSSEGNVGCQEDGWQESEILEFYIGESKDGTMKGSKAERDTQAEENTVMEADAASAGELTEEEIKENQKKIREYAAMGIESDKSTGAWLWNGKPVYWMIDDNGAMYQNGSEEAKKQKIYLIVKRDEDGDIKEVRQMTMEELAAEKMMQDAKKEGTVSGQ